MTANHLSIYCFEGEKRVFQSSAFGFFSQINVTYHPCSLQVRRARLSANFGQNLMQAEHCLCSVSKQFLSFQRERRKEVLPTHCGRDSVGVKTSRGRRVQTEPVPWAGVTCSTYPVNPSTHPKPQVSQGQGHRVPRPRPF